MGFSAALGMTAIAGASGAASSRSAGKANQNLSNLNAEIAESQAADALARGKQLEAQSRTKTRKTIGSQRARLAAQGIDINSGSAADVQTDTAAIGEMDALTIRNNAALEAWGYRVQGADHRARGILARSEGNARATQTVLTTGSNLAGINYNRRR